MTATKKPFEAIEYVRTNREVVDLSEIYPFYKLLLDSLVYVAEHTNESGIPDRSSSMMTQQRGKQGYLLDTYICKILEGMSKISTLVAPMVAFTQGLTDSLLCSLTRRANETSKLAVQLCLDSAAG